MENQHLEVIRRDKKNFDIVFLQQIIIIKNLIQQAKEFNVKNVLIKNDLFYKKVKNSLKKNKTKVLFRQRFYKKNNF